MELKSTPSPIMAYLRPTHVAVFALSAVERLLGDAVGVVDIAGRNITAASQTWEFHDLPFEESILPQYALLRLKETPTFQTVRISRSAKHRPTQSALSTSGPSHQRG